MHPVENYLKQLQEIYRTGGGTAEESYYGALETLLNEVGKKLKPKVRCVPQQKDISAGGRAPYSKSPHEMNALGMVQ